VSDIQKIRKNSHVVYPSGKPMIPHLLCSEAPPTKTRGGFPVRMLSFLDSSPWPQPKVGDCGKPAGQGIGVNDYSLTLDALHLRHPRLLQRQGFDRNPPLLIEDPERFYRSGENVYRSFSLLAQRKRTKRKGAQSLAFSVLLERSGARGNSLRSDSPRALSGPS
jgi:hypothetical protein